MATPPTIITSALPTERLNQIAAGKLTALAVTLRHQPDQKALIGELTFRPGKLAHPVTRAPIPGAKFVVVGHDHLQFIGPPLAGLGPVLFFDVPSLAVLEERVAAALQRRMVALAALAEKLKKLRINHRLDPEQLQIVGEVKAVPIAFELRGGPEGIWVSRIMSASGTAQDLTPQSQMLDLSQFQSSVDLELYLTDALVSLQGKAAARPAVQAAAAPREAGLEALAPGANALTLAVLAQKLGPDAVFGLNHPAEITQSFTFGKITYRFSASHLSGTTFKGSLVGPTGEKWADKFDLLRFPGISQVVASVLGAKLQGPQEGAPLSQAEGGPVVPSHLVPQVGEVWVMAVIIEREDQDEVRYACTNVDGKPFGATRLLKSAEFREVFVPSGNGWRLLIVMEEVGADNTVVYRQLDSQRKPRGASKRIASSILVTNFVPEATAY